MKTLRLMSGDEIPALGLGTWKSGPGEVREAVKEALRVGYRHIDCARIYGNEKEVGQGLREALQENGLRREDVWITSKLWNNAHKKEDVRPALERTLQDLGLDFLDMYLIHWPVAFKPEVAGFPSSGEDFLPLSEVPLTETWAALQDCVRAGLSRNIGVSNFSMEKLGALLESAEMPPTNNQIELHPLLQQKEMLEFCRDKGVMLTAYSPLGSTDRPERLKKPEDPELMDDPVITAVAEKHGATPAQVLIAWSLHRDTAVIPKSVTPARIMENFESAKLNLDDEDMNAIAGLDRHYRFVDGTFWESMPGSPYTAKGLWDE